MIGSMRGKPSRSRMIAFPAHSAGVWLRRRAISASDGKRPCRRTAAWSVAFLPTSLVCRVIALHQSRILCRGLVGTGGGRPADTPASGQLACPPASRDSRFTCCQAAGWTDHAVGCWVGRFPSRFPALAGGSAVAAAAGASAGVTRRDCDTRGASRGHPRRSRVPD